MSCRELVRVITDYIEGVLPPAARKRFEEHLALCEGCQTYLDQMRKTIQVVGRLSEESIPSGAKAALLQAFRDWEKT
ncbi:MAG TPA: zf-HC2 domain-containing protein [Candidatus Xenobia bacterium]|nr:zf-HC2 domain-containing protein [Candidatus Xenobia bacterium]